VQEAWHKYKEKLRNVSYYRLMRGEYCNDELRSAGSVAKYMEKLRNRSYCRLMRGEYCNDKLRSAGSVA